jgi:hypothetical protein
MAGVRVRLTMLAIVLAVLVFTGLRHDGLVVPAAQEPGVAAGQLDAPPVPEPDVPVMASAAATRAATAQTHVVSESPRLPRPTRGTAHVPARLPGHPNGSTGPRAFPLLI